MLDIICELCHTNYRLYKSVRSDSKHLDADMYWHNYGAYATLLESHLGYKVEAHTVDGFKVIDNRTGEVVYCK